MKELLEYRQKLIEKLREATDEFCAACKVAAGAQSEGWNAHQLAAHTRDVDAFVYGARIRRTLEEDNPEFESFDADAWMAAHYDPKEALDSILDGLRERVGALANLLNGLPPEAWARESRHKTMGAGIALQTWVERALAHIEEHLVSARQIGNLRRD
jgi:hypothetical protein